MPPPRYDARFFGVLEETLVGAGAWDDFDSSDFVDSQLFNALAEGLHPIHYSINNTGANPMWLLWVEDGNGAGAPVVNAVDVPAGATREYPAHGLVPCTLNGAGVPGGISVFGTAADVVKITGWFTDKV